MVIFSIIFTLLVTLGLLLESLKAGGEFYRYRTNYHNTSLREFFFPEGFSFGVATAAYQIEGGYDEDGKGVNLWDWFTHQHRERMNNNATGDVACDSYHKWQQDIKLLADLGVNHYRFSLSWSRILPNGTSENINMKGVNYYLDILQFLQKLNITPYVTLYHWDLPLVFHEDGGWLNPIISDYFAEYARVCFQLFGDYVKNWITINEPQTTCVQGYGLGGKAPEINHTGDGVYQCAYTNVLAHAKAYHIYNDEFREIQGGRVSIVLDSAWAEPKNSSLEEDQRASKIAMAFSMGLYANPIYNGNWPEEVIVRVKERSLLEGFSKSRLPSFTEEEIKYIQGTSDFFCLNNYGTYYATMKTATNESIGTANYTLDIGIESSTNSGWKSKVDWVNQVPWGFRNLINYAWNEYRPKEIIITENGWADTENTLNDTDRIEYIGQYLSALLDAYYIDQVNVTGYTVWSLLDNLEWINGYSQKLGLVQVNFTNTEKKRTKKESYKWYNNILKKRCLADSCMKYVNPDTPTAGAGIPFVSFLLLGAAVIVNLLTF